MKNIRGRLLAVLLAAVVIFVMPLFAFAGEPPQDAAADGVAASGNEQAQDEQGESALETNAILPLGGEITPQAANDYNAGDIAVINNVIDKNGLNWGKAVTDGNVPDEWMDENWYEFSNGIHLGVIWSEESTDKRIVGLNFMNQGLHGTLDLRGLSELQELDCGYNDLAALNLQGLNKLQLLAFYGNPHITTLTIQNLPNLQKFYCNGNDALTELSLHGLDNLQELECINNALTALNVQELANLEQLNCKENELTELNLQGLANLREIRCGENNLTALNVQGCANLQELVCSKNALTSLNVQGCVNLKRLDCSYNTLASLNVQELDELQYLNCDDNDLTALNVQGCANLRDLDCWENKITALNLQGCANLETLDCSGNKLSELNLQGLVNLIGLACRDNNLIALDLTGISLEEHDMGGSQTASLTLYGAGSSYSANVTMGAGATFGDAALSYGAGTLTSTSDATLSSTFTSPTGFPGFDLSGTLTLTYNTPQTITFDANGGAVSPASAATGTDGRLASLPTPTWANHRFDGWFTAATGGTQITTATVFNTSTTVYAHWTAIYALTVQAGTGGTVGTGLSGNYAQGAVINITATANANYTFSGWTSTGGGTFGSANAASTTFTMPGGATTITANFTYTGGGTPTAFTISFDANGGAVSVASATTGADGRLVSLPTPTWTDHRFDGWFTAASGGTKITVATVFTANSTVYAQWTAIAPGTVDKTALQNAVDEVGIAHGGKYSSAAWVSLTGLVADANAAATQTDVDAMTAQIENALAALGHRQAASHYYDGKNSYTKGSAAGLVHVTLKDLATHTGRVSVDGNPLTEGTHYTVISGSTRVTLAPGYLDTLAPGTHMLAIEFSDENNAVSPFTVLAATDTTTPPPDNSGGGGGGTTATTTSGSAKTGDEMPVGLYVLLMMGAAGAILLAAWALRKRRAAEQ